MCSKCSREQQANQATAKAIASSAAPAVQQPSEPVVSLPIPAAFTAAPSQPAAALQNPMAPAHPPTSAAAEAPDAAAPAALQPLLLPEVLKAVGAASEAAVANSPSQQQTATAAAAAATDDGADEGPPRRVQKNTNRCFSCNKKIGLTGFKCRCGFVFCGPHRLAEAHDCDFDYKGAGRESLAKANPLVQADRVARF